MSDCFVLSVENRYLPNQNRLVSDVYFTEFVEAAKPSYCTGHLYTGLVVSRQGWLGVYE